MPPVDGAPDEPRFSRSQLRCPRWKSRHRPCDRTGAGSGGRQRRNRWPHLAVLANWEASPQVDLRDAAHACEQVVPWMVEAGGGSILFVSSALGLGADPKPDYGDAAAKAALIAHAEKRAIMHAPRGVRVTAIAPGSILSPGGVWATVKEQQPAVYESVRAQSHGEGWACRRRW